MNPAVWPADWASDPALHRQRAVVRVGSEGHPPSGRSWSLQRRCSLSPRQFAGAYGLLALASVVVAVFFWMQGMRLVGAFAGLELLALGVAFVLHALHAADGETLHLQGGRLQVDRRSGLRCTSFHVDIELLRVGAAADGVIELRVGRAVEPVGRQAAAAQRRQVLDELRHELMQARANVRADD